MIVRMFIPGKPVPYARTITGRTGFRFYPEPYKSYRKLFLAHAIKIRPNPDIKPPYAIEFVVILPKPKNPTYAWPSRGDKDNFEKGILDGLVAAGHLVDDRHVVYSQSWKMYGDPPGVEIKISTAAVLSMGFL